MEEKQGTITEIIFRNDDNGYTVAVMETDEEEFTVVGVLPVCVKGTGYRMRGSFKVHPTYGEQFAFTEYEELLPEGADKITAFLASGVIRGIGPKTAALIVGHFGENTLKIIEEEPRRCGDKRIGEKKCMIKESYDAHRDLHHSCFSSIRRASDTHSNCTSLRRRLCRIIKENLTVARGQRIGFIRLTSSPAKWDRRRKPFG